MPRTPSEVVREFCAAWSRLDTDELMTFFTDDAVYHNMPGPPARGSTAVRKTIDGFLRGWQRTTWEIVNLASERNLVFAERVDRTDAAGRHVDLPLVGVFEIEGEKIRAWRDYFDMGTYVRAMTPPAAT
ncbi:MAG: nuclear transport factor 2 family protein [Dehalococcoidia bacterium]|nr:nuclear transport factor 2 family protein [Dehalococcoidia bacterium]